MARSYLTVPARKVNEDVLRCALCELTNRALNNFVVPA